MNPAQNGAEGIVVDPATYGPEIRITRLPDTEAHKHNLTLNETTGFFATSVELLHRSIGGRIDATDVRDGDELKVTHTTKGIHSILTGTASGSLTSMGRIFSRDGSGILFDNRWENVTITLVAEEPAPHPLEYSKNGDRFRYEVPFTKHTLEMVKYAQGFWIREAYDKNGNLFSIEERSDSQARLAFDKYKGKMVKSY